VIIDAARSWRTLLVIALSGFGIWQYLYSSDALAPSTFPLTLVVSVVAISVFAERYLTISSREGALWVVLYLLAICLFSYSSPATSAGSVADADPRLLIRFGGRTLALYVFLFLWLLLAPGLNEVQTRWRSRYYLAACIVGSVLVGAILRFLGLVRRHPTDLHFNDFGQVFRFAVLLIYLLALTRAFLAVRKKSEQGAAA